MLSALIFFASPSALRAATLKVSPVRLLMVNGKDTVTLKATNVSGRATLFQLEPQRWTQVDGSDRTEPTAEILAMPPIFRVEPGKTQIVRVALRRERDERRELTYRLFLTEVPDETAPVAAGIRSNLRISVPIFVRPAKRAVPVLEFSAQRAGDVTLRLTARNEGEAHALIGWVKLSEPRPGGALLHDAALAAYVLPGQTRSWLLDLAGPLEAPTLLLQAKTDDGDREATLTILPP